MLPIGVYRDLLDHLRDGVYFVDTERRITHWNAAAERITGYSSMEVVGSYCHANMLRHVDANGTKLCLDGCPLHATILDGSPRALDTVFLHHKGGHRIPIQIRTIPIVESDGEVGGAIEVFSEQETVRADFERRVSELRRRLLLDKLTQLPNREHAERDINTRLYTLKQGGAGFGVVFIDIDHFKKVNDTYGHTAGDRVLQATATNLSTNLRPEDMISRWGGEEFVGCIAEVDRDGLRLVAEKLGMLVRSSRIPEGDLHISITISIGATIAFTDDDRESIIQRADGLMYRSKSDGRDRITIG